MLLISNLKLVARCALGLLVLLAALLRPQPASAHGELLIRIAALTKQIEATTNQTADLYLKRGELYREDQNWTAAETDYTKAAELGASLPEVEFCRARMLAESGQLSAAREKFDLVVKAAPKNGEAFIGRARVLVQLSDRDGAIADYRTGLELLTTPSPQYYVELAQQLRAAGQDEAALTELDSGIKKFGPILPLQSPALDIEAAHGNRNGALLRIDSIIQAAQRKENWLARKGDLLVAAGRREEARAAYNNALEALHALPGIIQRTPAMAKLQSQIEAGLTTLAPPPVAAR